MAPLANSKRMTRATRKCQEQKVLRPICKTVCRIIGGVRRCKRKCTLQSLKCQQKCIMHFCNVLDAQVRPFFVAGVSADSGVVLWITYLPIHSQGARLWAASLTRPPSRPKVSGFVTGAQPLAGPKEWGGQDLVAPIGAPETVLLHVRYLLRTYVVQHGF